MNLRVFYLTRRGISDGYGASAYLHPISKNILKIMKRKLRLHSIGASGIFASILFPT